jgi:hypothetical protein
MPDQVILISNTENVRIAVHNAAASLINHVAHATKDEAIENAPEATGNLKSLIEVTKEATPEKPDVRLESGAAYSEEVNFGHHTVSGSFVPANPFFTKAIESASQKAGEVIQELGL